MPKGPTFPYRTGVNIEPFDAFASLTINNTVTATIVSFIAPTAMKKGYITLFGHGIDDVTAWPNSIFRIKRNSVPVKDYADIRDQLGEFREPQEIGPVDIMPGDVISVEATNNSAAPHLYAARLRGFFDYEGIR